MAAAMEPTIAAMAAGLDGLDVGAGTAMDDPGGGDDTTPTVMYGGGNDIGGGEEVGGAGEAGPLYGDPLLEYCCLP